MRWIMSTESVPSAGAVHPRFPDDDAEINKRLSSLKRTYSTDTSHIPGIKRKCSRLKEFSEIDFTSSLLSLNDRVEHSKLADVLLPCKKNVVPMCVDSESGNSSSPSTAEQKRREQKEIYVLQIQRAMIADEDGDRPIHIAVVQEDINLVRRLCTLMKSIGASLDIFNHLRQTPLHLAVVVRNSQIIKVLLQNGASVAVQDRHGNNSIQLAVKFFQEACFQVLLDNPNSRSALDSLDYEGLSAMHHAVINGNMAAVNLLYHCGADVNGIDGKSGRSGLMQAVISGNDKMVQLLLKCGGCVTKTDYSGMSALDVAHQVNNKDIIQLLEKEVVTKQDGETEIDAVIAFRTRSACSSTGTITSQTSQKRKIKKDVLKNM